MKENATAPKTKKAIAEPYSVTRLAVAAGVFTTIFCGLILRLQHIVFEKAPDLIEVVNREKYRKVTMPGLRGPIFDRNKQVLAYDEPTLNVIADGRLMRDPNFAQQTLSEAYAIPLLKVPQHFTDTQMRQEGLRLIIEKLAPALSLSVPELTEMIGTEPRSYIILKRDLSFEQASAIRDLMKESHLPGITLEENSHRRYPHPQLATHVVGFVNAKNEGVQGIERTLNEALTGQLGQRVFERCGLCEEKLSDTHPIIEPQIGRSVQLTLDLDLQRIVETTLDEETVPEGDIALPALKPKAACAILMNPRTGAILALANRPSHSLDDLSIITPNFAVSETFEPGSTYKIVAYTSAIERGKANAHSYVHVNGGYYQSGAIKIRDDHGGQAGYSVTDALACSSNVAAYKMALLSGPEAFYKMGQNFNFGQKTGLELTNEAAGILRHPDRWGTLSLSRMSFGYETNATPLQILSAYAAIANEGVWNQPHLVQNLLDEQSHPVAYQPNRTSRRVCTAQTARAMTEALGSVVNGKRGTAKRAAIPGITVAGKTGTSQRFSPQAKRYASGQYYVSFVGFAPAEKPEIAGIVVIDDPKCSPEMEYGGRLAAPLFKRMMERALTHLGHKVSEPAVTEAIPSSSTNTTTKVTRTKHRAR
jgi:cell division protein FtsI/penicillin-binding protein 2